MKNSERITYGLVLTTLIFLTATFGGSKIHLGIGFIPGFVVTLTIELLLSAAAIYFLRNYFSYSISVPGFKTLIKPFMYGIILTVLVNLLISGATKIMGGNLEEHPTLSKMNVLQVLIFIFIYASIAEEILFRGFLMNLLKPLEVNGITFFKRKISFPVIVSALAFGAAHLVLISTGVSIFFLFRIVVFTICLGLLAGYYQEKYNNNFYAIIVHMAGNTLAVIGALSVS